MHSLYKLLKGRLKTSIQTTFLPFIPFALPLMTFKLPYEPHCHLKFNAMTARQSYHLTFSRFSPSSPSNPSPPPKPPTPPTASKSPPPLPIPPCRCLPTSTSAQRLKSVRRRPYCPKSPPPFQPVRTNLRRNNGRALLLHARSCPYPRMKPFTALF